MQSASTQFTNTLQQAVEIATTPRLIGEWNINRYATISTIDNFGYPEATNGYDLELFPIGEVVKPLRPTAGISVAKIGEGTTTSGYGDDPATRRYYTASAAAKYKYWTSPNTCSGTISSGSYPMTNCAPYFIYSTSWYTNKLYFCFENSWSYPVNFDVQITTDGTNFTTVASNQAINATTGVLELYLQANNTWSTTVYRANQTQIRGVKLVVNSMSRASSFFNLIEMGARLENDLTSLLISYEVNNEMDSDDQVFPFGLISSNEASIVLSNTDGRFNDENASSIYYGLVDANVKFTLDIGIDTTPYGGSGMEYIRQFTMYSGNWNTTVEQATVPLKDASKFLQEVSPNAFMLENATIGKVVWRILDSIGFNSYTYTKAANDDPTIIPYYWTDKTKTVWDNIQELCRGTQNAVFFDEYGVLKIVTRTAAYDKTKAASWNLDGATNGAKQADIVDLTVGDQFEANKVTINYRPTALAVDENNRPISEVVWQPDGTVVLRSSQLTASMTNSQMTFSIPKADAKLWPFNGYVNIQGELIQFDAKQYFYVAANGTFTTLWITNLDQQKRIEQTDLKPGFENRAGYTGAFRITARGVDTTFADTHEITTTGFTTGFYGSHGGTQTSWSGGIVPVPSDSVLRLQTRSTFGTDKWYCVRSPQKLVSSARQYGFSMKFPKTPHGTEYVGGYYFWSNSASNSMYAVDIQTTANLTKGNRRNSTNEISLLKRTGGVVTRPAGKGFAMALVPGQEIHVDIRVLADATIMVIVNGRLAIRWKDPSPLTETNNHGPYVRAFSIADFEYIYYTTNSPLTPTNDPDDSDFLDLINGGYYSSQPRWMLYGIPWVFRRKGMRAAKVKVNSYIAEFGADVHEVRKYTVQYDKIPTIYSSLYFSNSSQIVCDEFNPTPFGATFWIANATRQNAVVNGSDSLTFGINNPVDQKMLITGRTVQQKEQVSYVVQNDAAIKARGEINLEISSDWLQTEAAAKSLGDWIVTNWGTPADEVEVSIFGNPLLQLTDIVTINYTPKNMTTATHKYFVKSIRHSWDKGLTTQLSLRRCI